MEHLQYPIGRFKRGTTFSFADTQKNIELFAAFPSQLEAFVKDWDVKILAVTYRDGGWNGKQLINHIGDSHGQLLLRFKSALVDEKPEIKPYEEDRWANLYDSVTAPIEHSLHIVNGVHARLTILFKILNEKDWKKTTYHPENKHTFTLDELLALYVWHGQHHLAHLKIIEQNHKASIK